MAPGREQIEEKPRGIPAEPSPSASIILISPSNKILLLHRVRTSSSFPSAHVFPGGNLSKQDGRIPAKGIDRHRDNLAYRTGAIRELFEESGILLARKNKEHGAGLLEVSARDRRRGRKEVHAEKVAFTEWLHGLSENAILDTDGLIPFTHWITPPNVPKRFTTQMYVYFLQLEEEGNPSIHPTADGGIENTAADFLPAKEWIQKAEAGEIILFPPQFLLLWLVSRHLDVQTDRVNLDMSRLQETSSSENSAKIAAAHSSQILTRRSNLHHFISTDGDPPWRDKYISPISVGFRPSDGRAVLGLEKPGRELKDTDLRGDSERVILVKFSKEGPRRVEVRDRGEILEEIRREKATLEKEKENEEEQAGKEKVQMAKL